MWALVPSFDTSGEIAVSVSEWKKRARMDNKGQENMRLVPILVGWLIQVPWGSSELGNLLCQLSELSILVGVGVVAASAILAKIILDQRKKVDQIYRNLNPQNWGQSSAQISIQMVENTQIGEESDPGESKWEVPPETDAEDYPVPRYQTFQAC